ncbi:ribonuclease 1-like [Herrania umbratica]|uniref:Ribonuclease 1-like n=1 Tax=Herrania umbratica TaxID=108875 RepID=A0A6J1BCB4_9ROSI|nr:ribonuclease 1-like [Herrania umbratica]
MHRLFLVAAVLATVSWLVAGETNFVTYKLSLRWPPAHCDAPSSECKPKVLNTFTIQGLWPQFADGEVVPPYDPDTNRCTKDPLKPDQILPQMRSIMEDLRKYWPNYEDYQDETMNENFWKHAWQLHGMCSDYPDNPLNYFKHAIFLGVKYIDPFKGTRIIPRFAPYMAKDISDAIKEKLGVYPQIACNEVGGTVQLTEVRLCFRRGRENSPSILQDCPKRYAYKCSADTDEIKFVPHLLD